jgi:hypothetical protein
MKKWLSKNKKWLFSGVVAAIILGLFGLLNPLSNNIKDNTTTTALGNNNTAINTRGTTIIINQAKQTIKPNVEKFIKSVTKEISKPPAVISKGKECIILSSTISMPIEIEKGLCFRNESNTQKATIQLVTRNAVKYTNFKGSFSCYTGETCSFGWSDAPKFHVISNGSSEKKVYIIGEN